MQTPARSTVALRDSRGELVDRARTPTHPLDRGFADTADHALVQRRIALTYGLFALLLAVVFALVTIAVAVLAPRNLSRVEPGQLTYLASIGVLVATWRVCRGKLLPVSVLGLLDGGCLVVLTTLLSATAVNAPSDLHVEHIHETFFALAVTLHAALVPAPPRWTVAVSGVSAIPLLVVAFVLLRDGRGVTAPLLPFLGVVHAVGLTIASTTAAWAISRVVYGLRVQVRSAMRFGRYTLEKKIGEGAMGSVYRARHATLRRPTALKLLSTSGGDSLSRKRFEREVQLTSQLTHPNTIAIYDYGQTRDGVFYYAMELLDGFSLAELVHNEGPQPPGRVIHILSQAAHALAEAHSIGLIHRDIKPPNILLCVRGGAHDFVKVLDFGLVKEVDSRDPSLSAPNSIAGTPLYMAPEAILRPGEVDARVDLYALGAVGYFLLTGHPPFEGANPLVVFQAHLNEAPRSPSEVLGRVVPHELEALILQCLAKSPSDRPASATELAERLDTLRAAYPWSEADAEGRWERDNERALIGNRGLPSGLTAPDKTTNARASQPGVLGGLNRSAKGGT